MEIDPKTLKEIVRSLIGFSKKIESEMLAYGSVLNFLAQSDPSFDMDKLLEASRKNPKISEVLDRKYDRFESEVIEHIEKLHPNAVQIKQILRAWKPEGPIN